ncbi:hypothetical protein [Chitinophaga solisilvae]|uniref:hypothetical protein n=1 Tax=Chitinophaga solisilvae TaxID=1233460 RepID=UPI001369518B|nr:hypothetical protein [Chitinophaga solisilvae]
MKYLFCLLLTGITILTSCTGKRPQDEHVRVVFDAGKLKFIASSLHPGQETISALYGNEAAYRLLSAGDKQATGAEIKLVTWRFHDNPQYTGSRINGALLRVETVHTVTPDSITYHLEGNPLPDKATAATRIQYILGYKPVQFPGQQIFSHH